MEKRKVLFYGAGTQAAILYQLAKRKSAPYGELAAFIDQDIYKQGHDLFGLPVLSWKDAQARYGADFAIYITGNEKATPEIIAFLLDQGVTPERIINYEPVEKRTGCAVAETFFNMLASEDKIRFHACRHMVDNMEYTTAVASHIVDYRTAAQPETVRTGVERLRDTARKIERKQVEKPHIDCANMQERFFFRNRRIRRVEACGYAPCNFNCCYCTIHCGDYSPGPFKPYVLFAEIFRQLEAQGFLQDDVVVNVGAGEFSICENGPEFAELVEPYPVIINTNAYVFSPQAAKAVESSGIVLCSIDSGTPETFHRVKGVDAFRQVRENLREYARHSGVVLKYILLDGQNDSAEDLEGFFALADDVAVRVDLTRDFFSRDPFSDRALEFAARYIKHFRKQGKLNMSLSSVIHADEMPRLERIMETI